MSFFVTQPNYCDYQWATSVWMAVVRLGHKAGVIVIIISSDKAWNTCVNQAPVAQSVSARYLYDMYTSHAEVESSSLSWGKLFYRSIKIIKAKNSNHLK